MEGWSQGVVDSHRMRGVTGSPQYTSITSMFIQMVSILSKWPNCRESLNREYSNIVAETKEHDGLQSVRITIIGRPLTCLYIYYKTP